MTGVARVPRGRGGVSGVLLILLGAWGGLAPFVGPYFRYAYTPDKAWAYTSGRLWLSVVPGAAAVLGGLLAAVTSHRAVGVVGALLGALGGAWFIVGVAVTGLVKHGSISPGVPLAGPLGPLNSATRVFLESLGFFTGTGVLIVFVAALALGRFSVVGVRDAALAEEQMLSPGLGYPPGSQHLPPDVTMPVTTGEFPMTTGQYAPAEQAETAEEQYRTTTGPLQRPPSADPGPLGGRE
jgi:hypothetical protein